MEELVIGFDCMITFFNFIFGYNFSDETCQDNLNWKANSFYKKKFELLMKNMIKNN